MMIFCLHETEFGICGFVLVGAIFVGSMQTVWQGQITPPYTKKVQHFDHTLIASKQTINTLHSFLID
jgi:phosphatidylserine decarboxylase